MIDGTVVIGSQWGDEGKGKITDIICKDADLVVRFNGGNNAGHTVVVGDKVFKFHILPSGTIYDKRCLIASGVVLDPRVLLNEISNLNKPVDLGIDPYTHIIFPYHCTLDSLQDGTAKIGTTKRGIGPCYSDKTNRKGIRFIDLLDKVSFRAKLENNYRYYKMLFQNMYLTEIESDLENLFSQYYDMGQELKKYLADVSKEIRDCQGKIIFEGAQGTFLDISHGTHPFVTSSNTISGSVFTSCGMPPQDLKVIGIVKAYTTRVGSGPFVTELHDQVGTHLLKKGNEYGTTTGRPRRCGWLDMVMLRYAHRLNGFTELAITKLDVLSGLDKIKVADKYILDGKEVEFPLTNKQLEKCVPHFIEFEGFEVCANLDDNCKKYLKYIETQLNVPIKIVSIGPGRKEII